VAVPKALRRTLVALVLFYVGGLALVVGVVPWTQIGLVDSPFRARLPDCGDSCREPRS